MWIQGYTRLTLQDYPGKIAAMCFTGGCQLRCPYCHNPDLALAMTKNGNEDTENVALSFLAYIEKRKSLLDGIVVSGGEPLLHNLQGFLGKVKELGLSVKLDTNGLLPDQLKELIGAGLVDYVALDYKSSRENFMEATGLSRFKKQATVNSYYDSWLLTLSYLRGNRVPYELRTTLVKELHPLDILIRMAESICRGASSRELWFLQTFEKTGLLMNDYSKEKISLSAYSNKEMEVIGQKLKKIVPGVMLRR